MKYICDRCDLRAETALGHHVCEAPTGEAIDAAIAERLREGYVDPTGAWHGLGQWSCVSDDCFNDLAPVAQAHGYRWTLSSVGDGTEYRATFEHGLGNTVASAIDTTPARAFARAWLRVPKENPC